MRAWIVCVMVWGAMVAAWPLPASRAGIQDAPFSVYYRRAVRSFNHGDYGAAERYLKKSIQDYGGNLFARYLLGEVYFRTKAYRKALDAYRELNRLYPRWPETWQRMGFLCARLKETARALAWYEKVLKVQPDNEEALAAAASLEAASGKWAAAERRLTRLTRIRPNRADYWVRLSRALLRERKEQRAIRVLEKGLEHISSPELVRALATVYFNRRSWKKAAPYFERLCSLPARDPQDLYCFGVVLHALGKKKEAKARFREALSLDPGLFDACYNLAVLEAEAGEYEKAVHTFQQCSRIDPQNKEVYRRMGEIYELHLFDLQKANECYRQAGGRNPR